MTATATKCNVNRSPLNNVQNGKLNANNVKNNENKCVKNIDYREHRSRKPVRANVLVTVSTSNGTTVPLRGHAKCALPQIRPTLNVRLNYLSLLFLKGALSALFLSTQLLTIFDMQFELKPKKSPTIYMLKQVEPQTLT